MAKGSTTATRGPTTAGDVKPEELAEELSNLDVDLEDRPLPDDGHQRRARNADDDDDRDRKPADLQYEANPRDALYKSFAKDRAEQGRELTPDYDEDAEAEEAEEAAARGDAAGDPEVVITAGPGAREVNQPQAPAAERRVRTDLQPDDLVIIKVDGADVQVTYAEMQALAQKSRAADGRLDEAKSLLIEAREFNRAAKNSAAAPASEQRPGGGQADSATRTAPTDRTKVDKARVIKVVDEIQTAEPEKAAEALSALIDEAVAAAVGNTSQPDVRSVVRQTLETEEASKQAKIEIGHAYATVKETFGDVLDDDDPRLANMAFEEATGRAITALKKAGTPDEDFDYISRVASATGQQFGLVLMQRYAQLQKVQDFGLPAIGTIFNESARSIRKWRTGDENVPVNAKGRPVRASDSGERRESANTPARIVVSSERRERKAGLSVQPRSASMRTDQSARNAGVRKNASSTIAEMAAGRK